MKDIEGSDSLGQAWFMTKLKHLGGTILDFGSGSEAGYGRILAKHGFNVICIDIASPRMPEQLPNLKYIQGDLTDLFSEEEFAKSQFTGFMGIWPETPVMPDFITNLSSIEHAGLAGRYGSKDDPDQDLKIMKLMRHLIKPDSSYGFQLLQIPVGIDDTIGYYHRIYGKERLPRLLEGWEVEDEAYWRKNDDNIYIQTDKETCLKEKATYSIPHYYAVGCFKLKVAE